MLRYILFTCLLCSVSLSAQSYSLARLEKLPIDTTELVDFDGFDDNAVVALQRLTKLQRLGIRSGSLSQDGWKKFSELTSLKELTLDDQFVIESQALPFLAELSKLEVLELNRYAGIDDEHLKPLLKLKKLRRLKVHCYSGTSKGLASLAELPKLESLSLPKILSDRPPDLAGLQKLAKLKVLELEECEFTTDEALAYLAKLSGLEELSLDTWTVRPVCWTSIYPNEFTGKGLTKLRELKQLRRLNLRGSSNLVDEDMATLAEIETLEYLNVSDCLGVTDEGIRKLAKLPRLEHLVVYGAVQDEKPRGEALDEFSHDSRLRVLELPNTWKLAPRFFSAVASLENLRVLNLDGCSEHVEGSATHLADAKELCELNIRRLEISSREFAAICTATSLKVVTFNAWKLQDEDMKPLAGLRDLKGLEIRLAANLGDKTMGYIGQLKSLENLVITGRSGEDCKLTDRAMEQLKNLTKLRSIDFTWLRPWGETMSGIENLSSLEAIRVNGCGKIGPEAVRRMLTLPNLRVASLHGVSGFPTDAEELVPSDSLENVHFSFSDENACKAGSEWAKKYPLLVFGGFSG